MELKLKDYKSLIEKNLVKAREYKEASGTLVLLKYNNKVFWDNLWHKSPLLLEARGHVFDKDSGKCIVRPLHKTFNYGEAGCNISENQLVHGVRKVNGFMGAVTFTKKYGFIYSTTGSLNSPFVDMLKNHISGYTNFLATFKEDSPTFIFEIVDKTDPHIINEEEGVYLLAVRKQSGGYYPDAVVDSIALGYGFYRPATTPVMPFKKLLREGKIASHEGFMVKTGSSILGKIKSNEYLLTKALARMKEDKLEQLFNGRGKQIYVDDMQPLLKLKERITFEEFAQLVEQDRIKLIREVVYGNS